MAINSVAERWSMRDIMAPWRAPVIPDGVISAGDRLHFLELYSGIDAEEDASSITEHDVFLNNFTKRVTVTDTTDSTVLKVIGSTHFVLKGICRSFNFSIRIHDGSSVDLSGFQVEAQLKEGGLWMVMQTTWGATTDEDNFVLHSNDDLEGLVHEAIGMAMLVPYALWALRFKAKLATVPGEPVTITLDIAAERY